MKKILLLVLLFAMAIPSWGQKRFKGLKESKDELTGTTFYKTPYTTFNFIPYIAVRRGDVYLRLKLRYFGDNWIFFNEVYLKTDVSDLQEIKFTDSEKRDNASGGSVTEIIDVYVDDDLLDYLRSMAQATQGKIFFSGDYRYDTRIDKYEIKYLNTILSAYDELRKENVSQGGNEQLSKEFIPDIQSTQWGMPMSEVGKAVQLNSLIKNETSLIYMVTCCGKDGMLTYNFTNGKLDCILLLFTVGESKMKQAFDSVTEELIQKYGQCSSKDETNAIWLTDNTKIALTILNSDKPSLSLSYFPVSK